MKLRFVLAASVAACGLAAAILATPRGHAEFGVIRPASMITTPSDSTATNSLSDRLNNIRRSLAIRQEQDAAWQRYAAAMRQLDQTSHAFEDRVASGQAHDDGTQRLLHALALNAAIGDLEAELSASQIVHARLLTQQLAGSFICKGLVNN